MSKNNALSEQRGNENNPSSILNPMFKLTLEIILTILYKLIKPVVAFLAYQNLCLLLLKHRLHSRILFHNNLRFTYTSKIEGAPNTPKNGSISKKY